MNRITQLLRERTGRKFLVPFLTVGYPTYKGSLELARTALDNGADLLELGMPFSDPLADGPQIQLSSQVALANGASLKTVLDAVATLRKTHRTPIVLMGYFNPLLAYGVKRFLRTAQEGGVDGLIIPDLPLEESKVYINEMKQVELSSIFLVAPTSTKNRVKLIEQYSSDFVYAVTVTGVTGARQTFDRSTDEYLRKLEVSLNKPFVAGFGVSSADSARRLARYADGVVIGSKLIGLVQEAGSVRSASKKIGTFLTSVRRSLDEIR